MAIWEDMMTLMIAVIAVVTAIFKQKIELSIQN
jgi:hypothetical protein